MDEEFIQADNKAYHMKHFCCFSCGNHKYWLCVLFLVFLCFLTDKQLTQARYVNIDGNSLPQFLHPFDCSIRFPTLCRVFRKRRNKEGSNRFVSSTCRMKFHINICSRECKWVTEQGYVDLQFQVIYIQIFIAGLMRSGSKTSSSFKLKQGASGDSVLSVSLRGLLILP